MPRRAYNSKFKGIVVIPIGKSLAEAIRMYVAATIQFHEGNRTHAAITLGKCLRWTRDKATELVKMGFELD
jgi:hypothetical protein